jgi:threonine dehydrogenase-like Zn-dependent dehydrogenase
MQVAAAHARGLDLEHDVARPRRRVGEVAQVFSLDVSPERCALAREFGADEVIDSRSNNPVEAIRELTHGEGAHKTLDTSGAAEARAAAVRAARTWGTACYVGERGQVTLDVSPDLLRRQITLVGSWTFSTHGQADCAEFIADHHVAVELCRMPVTPTPAKNAPMRVRA